MTDNHRRTLSLAPFLQRDTTRLEVAICRYILLARYDVAYGLAQKYGHRILLRAAVPDH